MSLPDPKGNAISSSQPVLTVLSMQRMFWHSRTNLALMDQAVVSGVNFLTGILLARFLGLEEFGRYTLVWMAVLLVNMLQLSLILHPMMSLGPKMPEQEMSGYFGAVLLQQVVLGVFCMLCIVLLGIGAHVYYPQWQADGLVLPLIAVIIAFQAQEFVRRCFFTQQRLQDALLNDVISYGGQLLLLLALFPLFKMKTDGVLWIIAFTSAVAATVGFWRLRPFYWSLESFKHISLKHWRFSRWLAAGAFMQWIGGQFFVIASAAVFSATAAGAIAAARNIVGPTLILFSATENVVSVQASVSFKKGGWPSLKKYLLKVSLYGGLANGLICLAAALFAPFWMKTLFGQEYEQYAYLVYWFSVTHFLMFFIRPLLALFRTVEFTRPIALGSILPMVFSLASSVYLVKMMGLTGAMIVMLGIQGLIFLYLLGAAVSWRKEHRE